MTHLTEENLNKICDYLIDDAIIERRGVSRN